MNRALAALLIVIAPLAAADDADIASGLENLEKIFGIAHALEVHRVLGTSMPAGQSITDPWGTAYRIDASRIVSAGSDRKFDEATWQTAEQFAGTAGDVVFDNGNFVRTNHNWLCSRVSPGGASASKLGAMRTAEGLFLGMRTDGMRVVFGPRMTAMAMEGVAAIIEKYRAENGSLAGFFAPEDAVDAWRTPFRFVIDRSSYRIISAGADRKFDPMNWSRPPSRDPAEDIVFENGKLVRQIDIEDVLERSEMRAEPIRQPPDSRLSQSAKWVRLDKSITAPVVTTRVEPAYPEIYRRGRISGIVILELAISETGTIENLAVIKSLGPAIDVAAADAVRKWKFAPAMRDGKPIAVLFNLTINFKLK